LGGYHTTAALLAQIALTKPVPINGVPTRRPNAVQATRVSGAGYPEQADDGQGGCKEKAGTKE